MPYFAPPPSKKVHPALFIDDTFLTALDRNWVGRVHSVYRHALNILGPGGSLYTLVDRSLDPAPRTAVIRGTCPFLGLQPGTPVVFRQEHLRLGDLLWIDLSRSTPWSGRLEVRADAHTLSFRKRFAALDAMVIDQLPLLGCSSYYRQLRGQAVPLSDSLDRALTTRIDTLMTEIQKGDPTEETIRSLVGLGRGLTPSGDDFLCGLLWASSALGPRASWTESLRQILQGMVLDTTEVSKQMLQTALEGVARQRIRDFLDMWMSNTSLNSDIINSVLAIGSTSGADQMIGMLMALELAASAQNRR